MPFYPEQPSIFHPMGFGKKKDKKTSLPAKEESLESPISPEHTQALEIAKEIKFLKDKPGRTAQDDLLIIAKAKKITELFHKEKTISIETAGEIMRENFLGPEAVEQTFGQKVSHEQIPSIPFTLSELQKAKELGEKLILRLPNYTIESLVNLMKQRMDTQEMKNTGGLRFIADSIKNLYFTQDKTKLEWALTSDKLLDNSYSKTAPIQLKLLVDYLETVIYPNQPLPEKYQEPIKQFRDTYQEILSRLTQITPQEFNAKSDQEIDGLIYNQTNNDTERQELVNWLENQPIAEKLTHTPATWFYDFCVRYQNAATPEQKQQLQEQYQNYTRIFRRSSPARLVGCGILYSGGVGLGGWDPDARNGFIGVFSSRN